MNTLLITLLQQAFSIISHRCFSY